MATVNKTLISDGTLQDALEPADLRIQDATIQEVQTTNMFFDLLARLLGLGAILGSLLFVVWCWLRLF